MRRDQRPRARLEKMMRHGHGQRRTLFRIGGGAQLVEQHERARIGEPREPVKIGDVRGEGGERRFDRLRIADVGEERSEHGKNGKCGWNWNSSLRHHGEQSRGLERHRLAAGIGPADDQLALVRRQFQNEWNRLSAARAQALFEQWMARALEQEPLGIQMKARRNRTRAQIAPAPTGCRPAPAPARPRPD
jgi:hypothetical protein